jgi:hypothetical protein
MNTAIIVVFQHEFTGKEGLGSSLTKLCSEVKDIGGACVYCPSPGNLVTLIRLLQDHGVNYGIHFHRKFMSRTDEARLPDALHES